MKKVLLLLLSVFSSPAFASGINANSASAPCTNNTLETYSGNTNLQADWAPNTIDLRWYNNNTLLTVQSTANTCIYDGALTIPATEPTRTGYTFVGWQVRPEIDFGTIPTNVVGTECWAKGSIKCYYLNTSLTDIACDADDAIKELQQQEWSTKYSHGTLYGIATCSTTGGTQDTPGTPAQNTGINCWCKATGYKATNSNIINASKKTLPWIFYSATDTSNCLGTCAIACASYAKGTQKQKKLFTPVSN